MNYKEFEYISFYMSICCSTDRTKLLFDWNKNNPYQNEIVDKYKNLSPSEFEKIWFPLCDKQKEIRKKRLEKFKFLHQIDFHNMAMDEKLKYIDAFSSIPNITNEWTSYFTENTQNNLKSLLFSLKPSQTFLLQERRDLNHFMNAIKGIGLDEAIKETKKRTPIQRKQDMLDFIHVFSQIYKIPEPKLIIENFKEDKQYFKYGDTYTENKCHYVVRINDKLLQNSHASWFYNFGKLFHELTHVRQKYWVDTEPENYPLFLRIFNKLDKLTTNNEFNNAIYELLPSEGHAYYMEQKFCEKCNERIFNNQLKQNGLLSQVCRTLYFDYNNR